MELQRKLTKILQVLDKCATHPHLDLQRMDMGIIQNLMTLYLAKLVNYIFQAIQENLLTSSSTAKEVSARIDLLQAV
jgi:hypothetical protein